MPLPAPARSIAHLLAALLCAALLTLAAPAVAAAGPIPAVQVHLLWGGVHGDEMDRQLDKAKQAGAGMVRVDFGWASLEDKGKGQYNEWYLGKTDMLLEKAEARGLKVLLTVTHTPCWASSAPESVKQGCTGSWWDRKVERWAPTDPADYAEAIAFLVRRYGKRIHAWELWNEPNASAFFKADDPARQYAELVKLAYPAMKAADPSAQVIAGSLMESDWEFTEALYAHGIKGHFDGFSFHPYTGDVSPLYQEEHRYREHSFLLGVPAIREVLARHGDAKPLWLTEFGWSTAGIRGGRRWENGVEPAKQAEFVEQAYRQMATWGDVAAGVYFNLSDTVNGSSELVNNFGLIRLDGSEKPAFAAFQRAAAALAAGGGSGPAAPVRPGGGEGVAPPPAGEPAAALTKLRVRRSSRVLTAGATLSGPATLELEVFRYDARRRRFERQAAYTRIVDVRRARTVTAELRSPRFLRGRWRVVAEAGGVKRRATIGAPATQAAARPGSRRTTVRRTNAKSAGLRARSHAARTAG